ncbi:MAG TPA: general stress protein [Coleofasciculaceae cyanobacterium]|jgi:hypothetical protein
MAVGKIQHAVGVFSKRQDAEHALTELRDAGFDMDKVSVIVENAEPNEQISGAGVSDSKGEQIEGGAKTGASTGAVAGGIIGLVGSLGVLAIPGVGIATEVGILLANTLIGGVVGAAGGALVGALVGWGVPEDRAKYYHERVSGGDYLVVVEGTAEEILSAEAILDNRGVLDWGIYDAPIMSPGGGRTGVL